MRNLDITLNRITSRRPVVLSELHPLLREKVDGLLIALGGRLTPWEGYRDAIAQAKAKAKGTSKAAWGQSPHNFRPALAVDLVLNPVLVRVRPHKDDPTFPDLWDDASPEAVDAWQDLEICAHRAGLGRVDLDGERDKPHVELKDWRNFLSSAARTLLDH